MSDSTLKYLVIAFFSAVILFFTYPDWLVGFQQPEKQAWGSGKDEPYMVIAGQKPTDASVSVSVKYFGRGESCSGFAWSASNGEVSKNILHERFKIDHNFSSDPTRYELRVPYQTRQPEKGCFTDLSDMEIKVTNVFDTVGFANLRIYKAGHNYDNKPISLDSKIEAKDCNGNIYPWAKNMWKGSINCNYIINGKLINQAQLTYNNGYTAYFDFSQFNDDTVIHYDILAGEDYRSESLDPKTGE